MGVIIHGVIIHGGRNTWGGHNYQSHNKQGCNNYRKVIINGGSLQMGLIIIEK